MKKLEFYISFKTPTYQKKKEIGVYIIFTKESLSWSRCVNKVTDLQIRAPPYLRNGKKT